MLAKIVSIGNSKGIRIPATLIRQYHLQDHVEIIPGKDEIFIRPLAKKPREGWSEALAVMHRRGEDALLVDDLLDSEELEWK
jgi:antitoxin MazE